MMVMVMARLMAAVAVAVAVMAVMVAASSVPSPMPAPHANYRLSYTPNISKEPVTFTFLRESTNKAGRYVQQVLHEYEYSLHSITDLLLQD